MLFAADRRRAYPEAVSCSCIADGEPVTPAALTVCTMNFGQHWRTAAIVEVRYAIELPARYFLDVLARDLPGFVQDAIDHPDPEHELPLEAALRQRGWPKASAKGFEAVDAVALAKGVPGQPVGQDAEAREVAKAGNGVVGRLELEENGAPTGNLTTVRTEGRQKLTSRGGARSADKRSYQPGSVTATKPSARRCYTNERARRG